MFTPCTSPKPRAHHQAYVFHPLGRTVPGTGAGDMCSSLCQEHTSLPQMRKKKNVIVLFFQTVPIVSSKQPLFRLNSKMCPKERDSNEWIGILYCLIQDPCWSSKETQIFPHPALSLHPLKESLLCLKDVELSPKGRNEANPRLGFCLNEPDEMSCEVDFPVVGTLSANPWHGKRNEEAQGGAEKEQYRAEPDLYDAAGKEQGMAGTGRPGNHSGASTPPASSLFILTMTPCGLYWY